MGAPASLSDGLSDQVLVPSPAPDPALASQLVFALVPRENPALGPSVPVAPGGG